MIHAYSHRASIHIDAKDTPKETAVKFRSIEASKEASFGASIPSFASELSESYYHSPLGLIERRRASTTIPSKVLLKTELGTPVKSDSLANQSSVSSNINVETTSFCDCGDMVVGVVSFCYLGWYWLSLSMVRIWCFIISAEGNGG
jgi:hypothetical protein